MYREKIKACVNWVLNREYRPYRRDIRELGEYYDFLDLLKNAYDASLAEEVRLPFESLLDGLEVEQRLLTKSAQITIQAQKYYKQVLDGDVGELSEERKEAVEELRASGGAFKEFVLKFLKELRSALREWANKAREQLPRGASHAADKGVQQEQLLSLFARQQTKMNAAFEEQQKAMNDAHTTSLEEQQNNFFHHMQEVLAAERGRFNGELARFGREVAGYERKMSAVIPHMLTILGIFVGALFVIVTALEFARGALESLSGELVQIRLGALVLVGVVALNIIFLFLHAIGKLTDKQIRVPRVGCGDYCGAKSKPNACTAEGRCKILRRMWNRYPHVTALNILLLTAYPTLWLWWFFERYIYPALSRYLDYGDNIFWAVIIFAGVPIVLVVICYNVHCWLSGEKEGASEENNSPEIGPPNGA